MRIRVFAVALLAVALSGCWVLDELSEGNKKMDMYMKKKPEAEETSKPMAGRPRAPRATEYFANQKNARTLTPGTVSGDIVSCKLKSGSEYMKADECVRRGGEAGH